MSAAPEFGLFQVLAGNIGVANLVRRRIYPHLAPQAAERPFVIYSRVSSRHERNLRFEAGMVGIHFQVSAFADTYDGVLALREALRRALDGYRGPVVVNGDMIWFHHIFIDSESDAFVEPLSASDAGIFSGTIDLNVMCAETPPREG
jgi:hypothetical protein